MKSSFSRSFSMVATTLLLALTILGASFQYQVNSFLEDTTVSQLHQDAQVVANLASAYGMDNNLTSRELMLNLDIVSQITQADVVICNNQGYIILCSGNLTGCDHDGWQLNQEYLDKVYENNGYSATGTIRNLYSEERYVVSAPIVSGEEHLGIVMVSTPTAGTRVVLDKIGNIFTTAAVFVVLVAVLGVTAFARRESKPLKELANAATAFGHGELDARVKIDEDSSEEMEELALAFNNMASSLQKSEYQRQEFVANVSHELKTPMTTISGFAEGILDGTIPPERERESLQIIVSETRRLSRLVRRMLDLSRLNALAEDTVTAQEQFDLTEVVSQVLISLETKITGRKLDVDVQMPDDKLMVWGDPDSTTQVCYNLVDNAAKFAPEGSTITVQISKKDGKAYTTVQNLGATIPPDELPLLFDRFHKADYSRSMDREGVGLGLYIVKTILNKLKENITVTSEDGVTRFTFTLTLA